MEEYGLQNKAQEIAEKISGVETPVLGFVLGSGWGGVVDALQDSEDVEETIVEPEAKTAVVEMVTGKSEEEKTETPAEDVSDSHPQVPFEQPLLPDESFALAMQVAVDVPAEAEKEPEPVPSQPQKEQPLIIEQTLF